MERECGTCRFFRDDGINAIPVYGCSGRCVEGGSYLTYEHAGERCGTWVDAVGVHEGEKERAMAQINGSFLVGSWIACEVTPSIEKGTRSSYESGSGVICRYFHEELPLMAGVVRDLKIDLERRYELVIQYIRPGGSGGMHGRVMYVLMTEEELRAKFADHPAAADAYIEIRQRLLRTDENRVVAEGEVIREFERFLSDGHLEEEYRRL